MSFQEMKTTSLTSVGSSLDRGFGLRVHPPEFGIDVIGMRLNCDMVSIQTEDLLIKSHSITPQTAHAPESGSWPGSAAVVTGFISAGAAIALYVWTLAPGLTSADGGDFVTAAYHAGIPHPSGYPLWTILGWLATRLPVSNPAIATNLLSAICAAVAIGVLGTLGFLTSRSLGTTRREAAVLGFGAAMLAAVSRPIWSQAVITEVYSLHVACGVALLAVLYGWIQHPTWRWGFAASMGVLALGMSNHHLTLTLVPLPIVVLIMLRPDGWQEQLSGTILASLVILRGWSELSGDPGVIALFQRLLEIGVIGIVVVVAVRRQPRAWLAVWRPAVLLVSGLLPHLYLPLAAAREPLLCWNCPNTGPGFFHLTNLTSYWGSHTAFFYRLAGGEFGLTGPEWALGVVESADQGSGLVRWLLAETSSWVTLPVACLAVVALIAAVRQPPNERRWLATLGLVVVCSGFVLPMAVGFDASLERQNVLRTYLGLPAAALALLGVAGAARLSVAVRRRVGPRASWVYPVVVAAAVVATAWVNDPWCSRRGNHLTEQLMHILLDPLPRDAIVLAVSDTTFFGANAVVEVSSQVASTGFSRSDLAVITPARIATDSYLLELHRNYGLHGPGHDPNHPGSRRMTAPVLLPTTAELQRLGAQIDLGRGSTALFEVGSRLTRTLVDGNIETRTIVMEMPAVHPWAMDRLMPDGLWLRLEPAPIAEIAREVIDADLDLWDEVLGTFESNPGWPGDFDLRLSLVDLRLGGVHVYRHRGLCEEAVRAAQQALRAAPESTRANAMLMDTLVICGNPKGARRVAETAVARDPWNPLLVELLQVLRGGGARP